MSEEPGQAPSAGRAETHPASEDDRLVGRTYTIPFDRVWTAAVDLVERGRGWKLVSADDLAGVIRAESETLLLRRMDDVFIRVVLDENAQTRVDVVSRSRGGSSDFGGNRRRIGRFFKKLDKTLGAGPAQILDPVASPEWEGPTA